MVTDGSEVLNHLELTAVNYHGRLQIVEGNRQSHAQAAFITMIISRVSSEARDD